MIIPRADAKSHKTLKFAASLRLLADVAQGRVVQSLATEGGLQSTLWAGPEQFSRAMKSGAEPLQRQRGLPSGPVIVSLMDLFPWKWLVPVRAGQGD